MQKLRKGPDTMVLMSNQGKPIEMKDGEKKVGCHDNQVCRHSIGLDMGTTKFGGSTISRDILEVYKM